jgi:hypothetical protein
VRTLKWWGVVAAAVYRRFTFLRQYHPRDLPPEPQTTGIAMPFDAGFSLGPFAVDNAGAIDLQAPAANYAFRWRDRSVHACLRKEGLALEVELGRVPSTAQAASARPQLLATMRRLPAMLPPEWRLLLRADHRLDVATRLPVQWPLSAVDLVAAQTGFLLTLGPYLDVLEDAGVADA